MKEEEIRPQAILDEYIRLSALDAQEFFNDEQRIETACVACQSQNIEGQFTKSGFTYQVCNDCGTLFQGPRPKVEAFEKFYQNSPSSNYWANTFFPSVAEARREKLFRPKAKLISDLVVEKGLDVRDVIDVGAGHAILLEELQAIQSSWNYFAIEPGQKLAEVCRKKGFQTLESTAENATQWHGKADLVICFEVIEHAHDPLHFINSLKKLLRPGGHLLISGLGVDGFDIQILWEKSKSVSPPHHINFLSIEGFNQLFKKAGLQEIQNLTPGVLDVDIVRKQIDSDTHRFFKTLFKRDEKTLSDFQNFLTENLLSSHTWVIAKN